MIHLDDIEVYKRLGYRLRRKTHRVGRLKGKTEYWIIDPQGERVAPDPVQVIYAPWYESPDKAWSNLLNGKMKCYAPRYALDLNLAWRLLMSLPNRQDIFALLPLDPQEAAAIIVKHWLKKG